MTPLSLLRAHRACILSARALLVQQLKAFDTALETADRLIEQAQAEEAERVSATFAEARRLVAEAEAEAASEHVEPLAFVPPGPWTGGPVGTVRLISGAPGILDLRGRLMKIDRDQPVPTPDPDTPIPSDRQVFR